jgi:hypothetical protein
MPTLIQKLVALGAETFLALKDTPVSFDGQQGRFAKVDPTEAKLVFGDPLETDGLVGAWAFGSAATTGQFDTDNPNPTLATLININFTDATGDKTEALEYLEPGDRLELHAQVGDKKYFYHVDGVTTTATGASYNVTYIGGDTSSLTAGDTFNIYSAVVSTINLPVIRMRPLNNPPASPLHGTIYYNGVTNKVMVYNGSIWEPLN